MTNVVDAILEIQHSGWTVTFPSLEDDTRPIEVVTAKGETIHRAAWNCGTEQSLTDALQTLLVKVRATDTSKRLGKQ